MRVLLCDKKTGLYFQSPDRWTSEAVEARDFRSSLKAVVFAEDRGLADAEVFMDFDDPEYNVHLPVRNYLSVQTGEPESETSAAA